jgi:hypothetical protein
MGQKVALNQETFMQFSLEMGVLTIAIQTEALQENSLSEFFPELLSEQCCDRLCLINTSL